MVPFIGNDRKIPFERGRIILPPITLVPSACSVFHVNVAAGTGPRRFQLTIINKYRTLRTKVDDRYAHVDTHKRAATERAPGRCARL